jgi:hypothetical protein
MPKEEFAETARMFFLNPKLLINQDHYSFEVDGNKVEGNLNRYEYFNLNFNH